MMVAVDFSPRMERIVVTVAERRLNGIVRFDRSSVAPRDGKKMSKLLAPGKAQEQGRRNRNCSKELSG